MSSEILFVGAGPVGLFTAIQLKLRLAAAGKEERVHFVEKNETYTRDQTVFLASTSFENAFTQGCPEFKALIQELKKAPKVKIQDLEVKLQTIAASLGIEKTHHTFTNLEQLKKDYPDTLVVIGSDGAHSKVRETVFDNKASEKTLQHVLMVKYPIEQGRDLEQLTLYGLSKRVPGHLIFEHVQEEPKAPGEPRQVSLQIFIDDATHKKLKDKVKFNKDYKLEQLKADAPALYEVIQDYLTIRENAAGETRSAGDIKLSAFSLDFYYAQKASVVINGTLVALDGDALMGVPFFRSINNGFLIASQLAFNLFEYVMQHDVFQQILQKKGSLDKNYPSVEKIKEAYVGKIQNTSEASAKRTMCALLMSYFTENHQLHAPIERIVPHWDCDVPHVIIKTQGVWFKNRAIYFDKKSMTVKDVTLQEFTAMFSTPENLKRYEQALLTPVQFLKEVREEYSDPKACLAGLEDFMVKQSNGPMQRFESSYKKRMFLEGLYATTKDAGLTSVQAVTKFNAYMPWAFVDVERNANNDAVAVGSSVGLNSLKVKKNAI